MVGLAKVDCVKPVAPDCVVGVHGAHHTDTGSAMCGISDPNRDTQHQVGKTAVLE